MSTADDDDRKLGLCTAFGDMLRLTTGSSNNKTVMIYCQYMYDG